MVPAGHGDKRPSRCHPGGRKMQKNQSGKKKVGMQVGWSTRVSRSLKKVLKQTKDLLHILTQPPTTNCTKDKARIGTRSTRLAWFHFYCQVRVPSDLYSFCSHELGYDVTAKEQSESWNLSCGRRIFRTRNTLLAVPLLLRSILCIIWPLAHCAHMLIMKYPHLYKTNCKKNWTPTYPYEITL